MTYYVSGKEFTDLVLALKFARENSVSFFFDNRGGEYYIN
jgi:hypothetical protein